jgi:hypothetical protein
MDQAREDAESRFDQCNSQGQWPFLSMEGSLLRIDLSASLSILSQLKKFPAYLLDTSNEMIGNILGRVFWFGVYPKPGYDTFRLLTSASRNRTAKNALHTQKGGTTVRLRESMSMKIPDFQRFFKDKYFHRKTWMRKRKQHCLSY